LGRLCHFSGRWAVGSADIIARVDVEATRSVNIMNFVSLDEVDPLLFYKPYYLEVGKGGEKAYVLLRDALVESGKIAISTVVIRTRQHLAAVKPQKKGLVLELMHFPEELLDTSEFKEPVEESVGKAEMQMAKQLIQSMTSDWKPDQYTDEYAEALEKMIEGKIEHGGQEPRAVAKKRPTNVVDLVSVLQQSIQETQAKPKATKSTDKIKPARRKKAA
jgi:DNA end-binding protein Ku